MDGWSALGPKQRARLRQEFLEQAGESFDRMFDSAHQDQLVTFTQREDLAVELGQKLAGKLLTEHVAGDLQVRPAEAAACCPKCKQAGERVTKRRGALPERRLTTRAGEVGLRRMQWRCRKCRIIFFSAGPASATGDGGLQPTAGAEGGAAGSPSGLVPAGE
jgi:hypothetical protein